jgi:raffinose/stachyose/melibiose transport system permease protein
MNPSGAHTERAALSGRAGRRYRLPAALSPYLYILPAALVVGLVIGYPLVVIFQESTQTLGSGVSAYVGSANYNLVSTDPIFWQAVRDNGKLLLAVPILVVLSLLFSVLLFERVRGWRLYRTLIFLPYIIAITVSGTVFGLLYEFNGPLNQGLRGLGLGGMALDWLGNANLAIPSVMSVIIWHELGFGTILFLARLMSVPEELFEAARMDGAGWWRVHLHITIPQLRSVIQFFAIIEIINMMSGVFSYVYVMTSGGPGFASQVLEYYIWQNAFAFRQSGIAAAAAVLLLGVTVVFVFLQFTVRRSGTIGDE